MSRCFLNIMTLLSLLLCAAAALMWARSQLHEVLWFTSVDGRLLVVGAEGRRVSDLRQYYFDPDTDYDKGVPFLGSELQRGEPLWFADHRPPPTAAAG